MLPAGLRESTLAVPQVEPHDSGLVPVPQEGPPEPDPAHVVPGRRSEQAAVPEGQPETDVVFRTGLPQQDPAVVSQMEPHDPAPVSVLLAGLHE